MIVVDACHSRSLVDGGARSVAPQKVIRNRMNEDLEGTATDTRRAAVSAWCLLSCKTSAALPQRHRKATVMVSPTPVFTSKNGEFGVERAVPDVMCWSSDCCPVGRAVSWRANDAETNRVKTRLDRKRRLGPRIPGMPSREPTGQRAPGVRKNTELGDLRLTPRV